MHFRYDINGLRAIAVIAVVLFHFNPTWLPGGFAGVDVFFVISGFLMTGIIFRGIESDKFSVIKFYISRANRIIPALAFLCIALMIFGCYYLGPDELQSLGKHAASSVGFFSNLIYWRESGYFDASSHEKWLLHTWSLSVEWQFYVIYPLLLVALSKLFSLRSIKLIIVIATGLGFIANIFITLRWPDASYYLLPSRVWEMTFGGIAYLYPLRASKPKKKILEVLGLSLILATYFLISNETAWPGYFSIFPVLGAFLVIQSNQQASVVTKNLILQKLGTWSYSIYLWHWPLVVGIYYLSLEPIFTYIFIFLSVLLGYLSSTYIEQINFKNSFCKFRDYLTCKPLQLFALTALFGWVLYIEKGFFNYTPAEYQNLIKSVSSSPFREECHLNTYQKPEDSCEYFGKNVRWATLGDSHVTEISYALAEKLKLTNIGLKHFSFSACEPSYNKPASFSKCALWYNEAASYIIENKEIKNVLLNHRLTKYMFGDAVFNLQVNSNPELSTHASKIIKSFDELIFDLAASKEKVYIIYPLPELPQKINRLIDFSYKVDNELSNIPGTSLVWYNERNAFIINHFNTIKYPQNVHFIKPYDIFCDENDCFAVKNNTPLYFDDNHLSTLGASELLTLLE